MVRALPREFLKKCSKEESEAVKQWWSSLQNDNRDDICVLLDRRFESLAYVQTKDEAGNCVWHTLPFVDDELPDEDADEYDNEWKIDFFHQLLDHPSFLLSQDVVVRTFALCSLHLSAIQAHEKGFIDCSFRCSDFNPKCPIVKFMAGFNEARLIGYTSREGRSVWLCRRSR